MLKRYHQIIGGIFRVVDACVIGMAWLASYWLRFHLPLIEVTKGFPRFEKYAALTPIVMILWAFVFSAMRVYHSQRMLRRTHEAQLILRSHSVAMLFFLALAYLFSEYRYSRGVMVYFGVLSGFMLVGFRLALRNALRAVRRRGFNLRHIILVGEGAPIETLVRRIDKFPELGFRVLGIVIHESSRAETVAGKPVLGHFPEIGELTRKTGADQVLIALSRQQYGELDRILERLKDEMVDIQLIPDIHEYVTLGCEVEDFDGMPIVNLNDSPLSGWGVLLKRLTDIAVAAVALVLLSPILLILAILVKLTSRGPVFYGQERMGLDGRTFRMLKFRSIPIFWQVSFIIAIIAPCIWILLLSLRRPEAASY